MNSGRKYLLYISFAGLAGALVFLQSCGVEKPPEIARLEAQTPESIDYNLHVKPILSDKCFACHGPDENSRKAGLDLSEPENALARLENAKNKRAITPGKLHKSELFHRITASDADLKMPPKGSNLELTDYERAVLIKWIEQGAEYKPHWAFIKPEKHALPQVKNKTWPVNEIDYFVLSRLEKEGLQGAREADKETLLRRVTLDLTGLPPTVEEMNAFLADNSPDAYEEAVDRLLQSPRYGEKMAVHWMDLARFADTHGYTVDRYRPMWPWRDWVIKAFNENMPYDQFVTWQLAGDLLPDAGREQRIATAFNRNHAQNMEGGIVNEEFRVEYVADRTNTLGTALMGITLECARCHDHKYDPISQKEYYSLFGFFNNIDEVGQISWDDAMPVPTMLLTDEKQDSLIAYINNEIKTTEQALAETAEDERSTFQKWQEENDNLSFSYEKGLQAHFTFDRIINGGFNNEISREDRGTVSDPVVVEGIAGAAFQSNGDDILRLGQTGVFGRADPFSIGVWVKIPKELSKGVIFHKGNGDILFNFRGYYLNVRDNKIELLMAHSWPYNNIIKITKKEAPKGEWIHLTMTYDGSSEAKGLKLYINGTEAEMITEKDNLYKDILFTGRGLMDGKQPGLQVGADWRGKGFTSGLVDELVVYERTLTQPEAAMLMRRTGSVASDPMPAFAREALAKYYLNHFSSGYKQYLHKLESLRTKRNDLIENVPEIMVMDEREEKRKTYLLERGEYHAKGEEVQPDAPETILSYPEDLPRNRLGLAKWLMHPDHPLTARVAVNRFWQHYFGHGLQQNPDDFGAQGGLPSHPELLDWLAVAFIESGWDIKAMQKLIVMSAAYRQSSHASQELLEKDPENVLLARGPSVRLTAEMIRDGALAASGLLSPDIGGPSVKPYQPEGLWSLIGEEYQRDTGASLYRRSLYTFWRRTNPPPSMNTFDAPSRSYCTVKRQQTNTPLQALILLNDPQFVEAARVVAENACKTHDQPEDRIIYTYRLLTARSPAENEVDILTDLCNKEYEKFKRHPAKMKGWLTTGEYELAQAQDLPAVAAVAVVANTIMNSDAFITKR